LRRLYVICNILLLGCQAVAVLCVIAQPAYAYVDPGSGLFAVQLIGTTIAGAIFLIRRRLRRIIRFLHLGRNNEHEKAE
jgi:hypothetical protein